MNYIHNLVNGIVSTTSVPRVLYHHESDERYYLITTRVPGETFGEAWPAIGEAAKQACVDQVVETCKELARKTDSILPSVASTAVSSRETCVHAVAPIEQYSHEALLTSCYEIGIGVADAFVLYHGDTGPTNVLVDRSAGCSIGIVDWEVTGFVPKAWIRTEFRVCISYAAMDAAGG